MSAPLRNFYSHPGCGFHWRGKDGLDVPTDGGPLPQPVCPRCEIGRLRGAVEALCGEAEYVVLATDDPGTAPVQAVAVTDLRAALITPDS